MNVSIHEDNSGASILEKTSPTKFNPRRKYYASKTIWFCEETNKRGTKQLRIDTVDQMGGIFTKVFPRETFEYLQKKTILW